MTTHLIKAMLNACLDHLGTDITYSGNGIPPKVIRALHRLPDTTYDIGDGVVVAGSAEFEFLVEEVEQPIEGDLITFKDVEYRVTGQPLRDMLQCVWIVQATEV